VELLDVERRDAEVGQADLGGPADVIGGKTSSSV
jgi:hypothetical protein